MNKEKFQAIGVHCKRKIIIKKIKEKIKISKRGVLVQTQRNKENEKSRHCYGKKGKHCFACNEVPTTKYLTNKIIVINGISFNNPNIEHNLIRNIRKINPKLKAH